MAHLRLYKRGTPGLTDGIELIPGTDLIDASGLYPRIPSGHVSAAVMSLCLRCDVGFKATNVTISTVSSGITGVYANVYGPITTVAQWEGLSNMSNILNWSCSISTVLNVNIMFLLAVYAYSGYPAVNQAGNLLNISFTEAEV
ncbi:putative membrane protein [Propionispora sp. 2/2-37]|jgi:hypothetical protein|uniref:hypothetical protein n=1 Tax=Propionispora sp. 2/2-37 TaxID=1677858 RepID=UPI0006BB95DD|nr:hypothetical protein [Propionispora sp. 2/2-37]CUH96411.1 putative membrane protein [Propionispora sp. 2/2-37]